MYVVSVQSDSARYKNWKRISWYTRTTGIFVVVYVVKILNGKAVLYNTLRNVAISWDLVLFNLRDDVCLLLSHLDVLHVQFLVIWSYDDQFHWRAHGSYIRLVQLQLVNFVLVSYPSVITASQLQSLTLKKLKWLKISHCLIHLSLNDVDAPVASWYCHGTSLGTW